MNSLLCDVASYVVNALWEIPLIACAGWVSSRMLRRWGPQPQHVMWVGTLLLCVIAPAVPLFAGLLHMEFFSHGGTAAIQTLMVNEAGVSAAARAVIGLPVWTIWSVFGLYLCTLAYFATRLLWMIAGARGLVRASTPVRMDGDIAALWGKVRGAFAEGNVELRRTGNLHGVVTIGARRQAVVLPESFLEQCAEQDFVSAMGHELAHIERRDYAKNLLYESVSLLAAFHPVIWMVKTRIVESREMICDAMVVERLIDGKAYRQSLLRLAERMMDARTAAIHAVGIFDANILEERIMAMKEERWVPGGLVRLGLGGFTVLLLLAAMATGNVFAKQVATTGKGQDAQWGKVYRVDKNVTPPVLTYSVEAKYPKAGTYPKAYQGVCIVGMIVDQHGKLHDVHIVQSLGKGFDANAMKAVEQFRFKPALRFGKPVTVAIKVEVNFKYY